MPIFKKKPKNMSKAIDIEVPAKGQPQSLAIAYSVKKKAPKVPPKKMAFGGEAESRVKVNKGKQDPPPIDRTEKPVPPNLNGPKSFSEAIDRLKSPFMAKGGSVQKIKHPKMVPQSGYSVKLRDEEDHLMESFPPQKHEGMSSDKGPSEEEYMADHFAEGGSINNAVSMDAAEEDRVEHPPGLESSDSSKRPPESEYMADHFAEGGSIDEESEIEHAASLAAAIMAKRKRFARGGAIHSEDSMESTSSGEVDLSRNADEDANMEDKASFDALRKENYSESAGLAQMGSPRNSNLKGHEADDINDRDIVSAIRAKMKRKSPISR